MDRTFATSTSPSDRRIGLRVDIELFMSEYIQDRPYRVLASNLSETGLYLHRAALTPSGGRVQAGTAVGLELELPGTGEVIWARGEVCREQNGEVRGGAVRFAAMPKVHAELLRDFCHEARLRHLDRLLEKIRLANPAVPSPRPTA